MQIWLISADFGLVQSTDQNNMQKCVT